MSNPLKRGPLRGLTPRERRLKSVYPDRACAVCHATYTPTTGNAPRCPRCVAADPRWRHQPHPEHVA